VEEWKVLRNKRRKTKREHGVLICHEERLPGSEKWKLKQREGQLRGSDVVGAGR
jgi:hypothetical protein